MEGEGRGREGKVKGRDGASHDLFARCPRNVSTMMKCIQGGPIKLATINNQH